MAMALSYRLFVLAVARRLQVCVEQAAESPGDGVTVAVAECGFSSTHLLTTIPKTGYVCGRF